MRRLTGLVAALALAASALAGCLAPAVDPAAAIPPVPLPGFLEAVKVGEFGNEPVIRVAPDGTIFVMALQYLYVSRDNGATFEPVDYRGPVPVYASDPALAMSPTGRAYAVFSWPYAGHTAVCGSSDRGESWECSYFVVPGATDRFWALAPTENDVYVITGQALATPTFAVSHDQGKTWAITHVNLESSVQGADLAWDPISQTIVEAARSDTGPGWGVREFSPAGEFLGFTPMDVESSDPTLAVDAAGTWWATACAEDKDPCAPAVAKSTDRGATWTVTEIPIEGETFLLHFVAAGPANRVATGWYETSAATADDAGAEWRFTVARTVDGASWNATTLSAEPVHKGSMCSSISCLGEGRFAGDFIGLAVDFAGGVHSAWVVQTGEKDLPSTQVQPSGPWTEVRYAREA